MSSTVEVRIFENPKKTVKGLAKKLRKITANSLQSQFHIALSGGSTPQLLFEVIVSKFKEELPWEKLHFWWGDERCVEPENSESNYKLALDNLLSVIPVDEKNIHRIKGEAEPAKEANRYSSEITQTLNTREGWPVFDLIILGLGEDGHTASIFQENLDLFDSKNICEVAIHPKTGQKRITLTGKVLNNSNRVFFLVTGKNKAQPISEIMNDDEHAKELPAYFVQPENGEMIWFIDQDAAELIS
jgi:6-phosphogluconolactonase